MLMVKEDGEVLCGTTFRVYEEVSMCNIFYFAVQNEHQGKKIGAKLLLNLKSKFFPNS